MSIYEKDEEVFRSELLSEYFCDIFKTFSHCADNIYFVITHLQMGLTMVSQALADDFDLPGVIMPDFGKIWGERIEENHKKAFFDSINIDPAHADNFEHDLIYRVKNRDGQYVTISCKGKLITDSNNVPVFFTATIINHEATETIDPVTGLFNRNNLTDILKKYTHDNRPYYLMLIGILNYAEINRMYGYRFGNQVLKEVSEVVLKQGNGALVFRGEGVKTALLFEAERYDLKDITEVFNNIRDQLYRSLYIKNIHIALEVCGGAILANEFSTDYNTIYNSALYALSVAKEEKLAELQVFENDLFNETNRRLEILNAIRNDIADGLKGFYLCYQPIVSAETNKVCGMEALLRWRSKKYGVVPPNDFIPWLERDPIFFELGNWILKTAMHDTKALIERNPEFVVNVNLAYPQLQRSDFKTALNNIIKEEEFPAENLKLELTERCRLRDMNLLRNDMIFFKSSGMQTALDDFGTGYSALSLLTELPVDQVKIDRSFVINIENDIPKQCLLRAITTCTTELGKKVCVEGVETKEMRDYLRENFSVSFFQGYLYSKPIVFDEFLDWYDRYEKTA
ncbi:MAG: EAL domain-containing protein [Lachnospiraceae bacterium]|nr:EAL domain-containing protein [Lachnospiraceae bacterium]